METLQNITTNDIRKNWHIYKDIVKELELFDNTTRKNNVKK